MKGNSMEQDSWIREDFREGQAKLEDNHLFLSGCASVQSAFPDCTKQSHSRGKMLFKCEQQLRSKKEKINISPS